MLPTTSLYSFGTSARHVDAGVDVTLRSQIALQRPKIRCGDYTSPSTRERRLQGCVKRRECSTSTSRQTKQLAFHLPQKKMYRFPSTRSQYAKTWYLAPYPVTLTLKKDADVLGEGKTYLAIAATGLRGRAFTP